MTDINYKLKSEFKNFIGYGLKIYYSINRPLSETMRSLEQKGYKGFVWEFNNKFLITHAEIPKEDLKTFDLKEFDYNFMVLSNEQLILNYPVLFDICCFNYKDVVQDCINKGITETDIKTYFKDWLNVQDCINNFAQFEKDYFNLNVEV